MSAGALIAGGAGLRRHMAGILPPWLASYGAALLIGLYWTWRTLPRWAVLGRLPQGRPSNADLIQHVMGQRYFWHQPWYLHAPLTARWLDAPHGVMIGFTDSLPLVALLLKPLVPWLPAGFQAITPWLALSWVLQPVAAVYALRGTGERRLLPALAVAACASAMPSFLMRAAHAALSSHFLLLVALGLSLRLATVPPDAPRGRRTLAAAVLLIPVLLLIHPYLMAMASVLLAAAPLTLLLHGARRRASVVAASLCGAMAATAGLAWGLGYAEGGDAGGFGIYSMNLLSPIWPALSGLAPEGMAQTPDATGGQYEGYQYLGAGLLAGIAMLLLLRTGRRNVVQAARRHPGLAIACAALTVFALSSRIYAGGTLLLSLPVPPGAGIFRVSGRFFWPVAYTLLVATVAGIAALGTGASRFSSRPLAGLLALCVIAALQTADARSLWLLDCVNLRVAPIQTFDAATLRRAMTHNRTVSIYPAWPCRATRTSAVDLMDVLSLADSVLIRVDTMYTARQIHPPVCDPRAALGAPLAAGEVRVVLPQAAGEIGLVPQAGRFCRMNGRFGVCGRSLD